MHPDNAVAPRDAGAAPSAPAFQLPLRPGRRPEVDAVAAAVLVGMLSAILALTTVGWRGTLAAVIAVVFVCLFFASGLLPLLVAASAHAGTKAALGLLLVNYTVRLLLALLALTALARAQVVHMQWLGATVVCCTLAWTTAHLAAAVRSSRTA